jgi:hypothetical protein
MNETNKYYGNYSFIFIHLFNYIHSSIQLHGTNKHYRNYSSIFIHLFNRMKQINIIEIIHLYSFIYSTIFNYLFIHLYTQIYSIIYSIAEFMNETLGNIVSILPLDVAATEESVGCSRATAEEEEACMRGRAAAVEEEAGSSGVDGDGGDRYAPPEH